RVVADRVAQQGHREVVQRRDHHAPDLARLACTALGVEDLDQSGLALYVIVRVIGALQRDVAGLGRAVDVFDVEAPRGVRCRPELVGHHLAEGGEALQSRKYDPALLAIPGKAQEIGGEGYEIGRLLAQEPLDLVLDGRVDVQGGGGTGGEDLRRRAAP